MASQNVEATFDDKQVVSFFKSLRTNLSKIKGGDKRFTGMLSAIVFGDVMDHFAQEEGSQGPWKQWSDSYSKRMNAIGRGGNKILQFNGRLRQEFKPANVRTSGQDFIWFNNAQTKSGFPYAALHDEGGDNHAQRDFMWLSNKGAEKISRDTLQFMLEEGV